MKKSLQSDFERDYKNAIREVFDEFDEEERIEEAKKICQERSHKNSNT